MVEVHYDSILIYEILWSGLVVSEGESQLFNLVFV
jgi:hypothetical protein